MTSETTILGVGDNPTPIWGMTNAERLRRIATAQKHPLAMAPGAGPQLLVNLAFVFDPPLLRHMAQQTDTVLMADGVPVIAHVRDAEIARTVAAAMERGAPLPAGLSLARIDYAPGFSIHNAQLRKREQPFVLPLTPATVREIERASYFAAYKGVTDILTKHLWPEWALVLTRFAARIGISPNGVTAIGFAFCLIAMALFWHGWFWSGLAAGLVFMVLDTVDGKLARCTITSSWWGNIFDHGIDLIHPPFWYFAWGIGLGAWGLALAPDMFWTVQGVLLGGYVVQRLIEGVFMRKFGMHIHVWRKFDSDFRLITARRNPNVVILVAALIFGRPDIGLIGIAVWTVLSLVVHAVQLVQAMARHARGEAITSWLLEPQA